VRNLQPAGPNSTQTPCPNPHYFAPDHSWDNGPLNEFPQEITQDMTPEGALAFTVAFSSGMASRRDRRPGIWEIRFAVAGDPLAGYDIIRVRRAGTG
jgi:hypothetical protein